MTGVELPMTGVEPALVALLLMTCVEHGGAAVDDDWMTTCGFACGLC